MHSPRGKLLARLLEAHERSVSYSRPAPWPRDVILKLDAKSFPEAFAPDGRERRAALLAAALELEAEGRARVVRNVRGPLAGEPKEIRLGPPEVERAYHAARELGYEPLAVGLAKLERHASRLAAATGPSWMREFLESLATGARGGDLGAIGIRRERIRREWRDLIPALTAAAALAGGVAPGWERMLSERILGDSKLLGRVRGHVVNVLVHADPRWDGIPPEEAGDLLESYGVRRKPGLIRCAGAATLCVGGSRYRLEDFTPVAHLPETWAEAWIEGILGTEARVVTTIENEYPFLAYVEEAGGPGRLGSRGEIVVYTSGFPTPSLVGTLARLGAARDFSFRHWGDADVGGIRIWWLLRSRIGRPVEWFRTTADWVAVESRREARALSGLERAALSRIRAELAPHEGGDVASARDLIDALLEHGVKLEQERY